MKKKLRIPLILAGILAVFCLGFLLAGMTIPRSFDHLSPKRGITSPARASESITIVHEGTYPGLADVPISKEQAAPGRRAMYALQKQKYTWILPFRKPRSGGVAIYEMSGCTPEYVAYWDGKYLWLPKDFEGPWRGYRPSHPSELSETLESIYNS